MKNELTYKMIYVLGTPYYYLNLNNSDNYIHLPFLCEYLNINLSQPIFTIIQQNNAIAFIVSKEFIIYTGGRLSSEKTHNDSTVFFAFKNLNDILNCIDQINALIVATTLSNYIPLKNSSIIVQMVMDENKNLICSNNRLTMLLNNLNFKSLRINMNIIKFNFKNHLKKSNVYLYNNSI